MNDFSALLTLSIIGSSGGSGVLTFGEIDDLTAERPRIFLELVRCQREEVIGASNSRVVKEKLGLVVVMFGEARVDGKFGIVVGRLEGGLGGGWERFGE